MSWLMSVFASLVTDFADVLHPLFQSSATAAAIILFTALVRLAVHPLSRASARGQRERTRLQPQLAALRKKYGKDREGLQKATMELHKKEKVSPLSGCLPGLFQLPAFFLLYHLFSRTGGSNGLLSHHLFAAPLSGRWTAALAHGGLFGGAGLVYLVLFVIIAAVATFNYRRMKIQMANSPTPAGTGPDGQPMAGMGAITKMMPLMSFATIFTIGYVPLAAGLYVVTSTTWSAVERYFLYRDQPAAAAGAAEVAKAPGKAPAKALGKAPVEADKAPVKPPVRASGKARGKTTRAARSAAAAKAARAAKAAKTPAKAPVVAVTEAEETPATRARARSRV